MPLVKQSRLREPRWISLVILLGLSAAVYVSIMFKIIKFGA